MRYDVGKLDLGSLLVPLCRAGEALARLDERIARSPIGEGFLQRQHFHDAAASLWIDGELVHVEDLVLHDARMDVRAPSHELTIAHGVLRARRQILAEPPGWALSPAGLAHLRGRPGAVPVTEGPSAGGGVAAAADDASEPEADDAFAEIDALLARSRAVLDGLAEPVLRRHGRERDPFVYDADWDEDERLAEWKRVFSDTAGLPPVLRAALLLDAWNGLQVLQHAPWLGRQLVAAFLREQGTTGAHLPAVNVGLRAVPRERRHAGDRLTRLMAILEAFELAAEQGLKTHDRLVLARLQLQRRLGRKRAHSKLPRLIDLVIARPLVSAGIIASELGVTIQGALGLANELQLREITGRERYRAWSIL
ncbi:RHE_PE00001 family protein [Mycoplana dimorpha]|uniref:DNA binding protein with HTH domain n=1 Tax=Mycoplana dimorpha TaxID=28320 RepID=A0A2T5B331_MYCDI|nr:RHE_PE00001 family protein [Mycoplana dimorpha]PTM93395.1 DNA binding protein with HTH domain [Mycoplana dimorpha]